jgi:hypothetical protein
VHPRSSALGDSAGGAAPPSPALARRQWTARPHAPIVLPTGLVYDALDVAAVVGARALARLRCYGLPVGPVIHATDRYLFLVTPHDAREFAERADHLAIPELDISYRGTGDWVVLPPSRGDDGEPTWARGPEEVSGPVPVGSGPLGTIAYAAVRRLPPPH